MAVFFGTARFTGGIVRVGPPGAAARAARFTGGVFRAQGRYTPSFFQHAGIIISYYNSREVLLPAIDAEVLAIQILLDSADMQLVTQGLAPAAFAYRQAIYALREVEMSYVDARLTDINSTVHELGADTTNFAAIMGLFLERLEDDQITINASVVTIGTPVQARGTGNASVVMVPILDGVTPPIQPRQGVYGGASRTFAGKRTELMAESEIQEFRCIADNGTSKVPVGSEQWRWWSGLALATQFQDATNPDPNGSTRLQPIQSDLSLVRNPSFDAGYTGWAAYGSAVLGTNIVASTAVVYRGAGSVYILGTAVSPNLGLYYALPVAQLTALRMYCFSIRYRVVGGPAPSGVLTVNLNGSGYAKQTGDSPISVDLTTLSGGNDTGWRLATGYCLCPATIPTDLSLLVNIANLGVGVQVYIDDLGFSTVAYAKGVGAFIVAGDVQTVIGDQWRCVTSNDDGGVFQAAFRRRYGVQFPSNAVGGEVVSDSLAT